MSDVALRSPDAVSRSGLLHRDRPSGSFHRAGSAQPRHDLDRQASRQDGRIPFSESARLVQGTCREDRHPAQRLVGLIEYWPVRDNVSGDPKCLEIGEVFALDALECLRVVCGCVDGPPQEDELEGFHLHRRSLTVLGWTSCGARAGLRECCDRQLNNPTRRSARVSTRVQRGPI